MARRRRLLASLTWLCLGALLCAPTAAQGPLTPAFTGDDVDHDACRFAVGDRVRPADKALVEATLGLGGWDSADDAWARSS